MATMTTKRTKVQLSLFILTFIEAQNCFGTPLEGKKMVLKMTDWIFPPMSKQVNFDLENKGM
jgi:hypothetical protein